MIHIVRQSADECGWRSYPPRGFMRLDPAEDQISFNNEYLPPDMYASLDVLERMVNNFSAQIKTKTDEWVAVACEVGTGYWRVK